MNKELEQAINEITPKQLDSLDYGTEIVLTDKYTLSKYTEEEVIVVVRTKDWVEELQVLWDDEGNITYESLI